MSYDMEAIQADTRYLREEVTEAKVDTDHAGKPHIDLSMGGMGLWWETAEPPPKPGQFIRLYGRGFGFPIRGVTVEEDDGSLRVLSYLTEEEHQLKLKADQAASDAEKRATWKAGLPEFEMAVAALPPEFQARIRWFRRDPNWGWRGGGYELFCCTEAVKIAAYFTDKSMGPSTENAQKFYDDREMQKEAGVALDEHSGNTFGKSLRFACLYLESPVNIWRAHGAICPLLGCTEAGCFAGASQEEILAFGESYDGFEGE